MTKQRRQFSAKFKFQVAVEALKELKTINEIASQYEVGCLLGATQVKQWKKQLQEGGTDVFSERGQKVAEAQADVEANLYEQIGRGALWAQDGTAPRGYPAKKKAT